MEARWHGKFIARGFVESAINQVFAKRFVKKQQMRWSDKNRTDCCKRERQCFTKISSDTSWPGTYLLAVNNAKENSPLRTPTLARS